MKLRKFRTLEDKINLGLKIFCCLLILTIIVMGKSFAEYKQEAEVTFIKARVGRFKTNDIQLAMKLDGEEVETPPSKDNYTVDISCNNADGSWDYDEWLAKIGNITSGKVKCEVNFSTPAPTISEVTATSEKTSIALSYTASGIGTSTVCKYGTDTNYGSIVEGATNTSCNISNLNIDTTYYYQVCAVNGAGEVCKEGNIKTKALQLADNVKIGDYISMTPTSTSYTISKDLTGYSTQTINPSELNLWRVIRKNSDGTVDMVSEYVSSKKVYFSGLTGYLNLVAGLNTIAAQYTDGVHVTSARHMGFENQELTLSKEEVNPDDSSYFRGPTESGHIVDVELVNVAYGGEESGYKYYPAIRARNVSTNYYQDYYLVSRYCLHSVANKLSATYLRSDGYESQGVLIYVDEKDNVSFENTKFAIRPIVTIDSTSSISKGNGSSESPYKLN